MEGKTYFALPEILMGGLMMGNISEKLALDTRNAINEVHFQRRQFVIIGLTGLIGSGCSSAANALVNTFEELGMYDIASGKDGFRDDDERDAKALLRFAKYNWVKFNKISVRDVILSFVFQNEKEFFRDLVSLKTDVDKVNLNKEIKEIIEDMVKKDYIRNIIDELCQKYETVEAIKESNKINETGVNGKGHQSVRDISEIQKNKYMEDLRKTGQEENTNYFKKLIEWNTKIEKGEYGFDLYVYTSYILPKVGQWLHDKLGKSYTQLFQKYGNYIRKYGSITPGQKVEVYALAERINRFIKIYRHPFKDFTEFPVYIVIDSIKNLYESMYLSDRYSAYYLVAITADENIRRQRMMDKKKLSPEEYDIINLNERPNEAKKLSEREQANKDANEAYDDQVRKDALKNGGYEYFLQDVEACIQNADIFIRNNASVKEDEKMHKLKYTLIRYVSLMIQPGLLLPTDIERCMQVAFSAKVNSGCLSRQVGAVVTDKNYQIVSLGWNDVPCGSVTCNRRNLVDLVKNVDKVAYSDYEMYDEKFSAWLNERFDFSNREEMRKFFRGLPIRFCFKDLYQTLQDDKNQVHTRALHGEEKALLAAGYNVAEGYLFTTSSPCELCAKNAKDHKIKRIYYIEPYSGTSQNHVLSTGCLDNRPEYELFTGAIGRAYYQLYNAHIPYKDQLEHIGFSNKNSYPNTEPIPGPKDTSEEETPHLQ